MYDWDLHHYLMQDDSEELEPDEDDYRECQRLKEERDE